MHDRDEYSSLSVQSDRYKEKRFITLTPEANVVKLFASVIYGLSY